MLEPQKVLVDEKPLEVRGQQLSLLQSVASATVSGVDSLNLVLSMQGAGGRKASQMDQ